jgi:Protein of unknown function (DUF1549)/Protein of unknown function (DUF1553)
MLRTVLPLVLLVAVSISPTVPAADLLPADQPIPDVIDHYVDAKLKSQNVTSAPQAVPAALLRRTMLDLIGRIPAAVEAREYIASDNAGKRAGLVERLMKSPEFIEQQAVTFDTFMTQGNGSIRGYLQKAFQEGRSWERIFRDLIIDDPKDPLAKEAANFLRGRAKDADQLANDVSVVFFGVNVSCAKCHDHPLVDSWKQSHFYGMKSFFNRTFVSGTFIGEFDYGNVSYKTTKGETREAKLMFLTGTVVKEPPAKELSAKERRDLDRKIKQLIRQKKQPPAPKYSRRKLLVETALKPGEDRYFARNIVNRVWRQFMGYGLVMPLDQMHSANPPSHPELLDWLARDLITHNYDLRRLVRGIVLSRAYSRSSRWAGKDRPNRNLFAVAEVKPLTPYQLARSLSLAAQDPQSFADPKLKPRDRASRISQAANASNASRFQQPGENFQVSADEALFFTNSPEMQKTYLNGGLVRRLEQIKDPAKVAETAVWSVLSRPPTKEELHVLTEYLSKRTDRPKQARRQIVWSLMTGSEFRFNY